MPFIRKESLMEKKHDTKKTKHKKRQKHIMNGSLTDSAKEHVFLSLKHFFVFLSLQYFDIYGEENFLLIFQQRSICLWQMLVLRRHPPRTKDLSLKLRLRLAFFSLACCVFVFIQRLKFFHFFALLKNSSEWEIPPIGLERRD